MADSLSAQARSNNMSKISGKDTKPEITVRSFLHRKGFRFRKNLKKIYGNPDIVLKKYTTIIFVDGCFWHRHRGCKYASTPKSRKDFWKKKFRDNIQRDRNVNSTLKKEGWKVLRIWECEIKDGNLEFLAHQIKN